MMKRYVLVVTVMLVLTAQPGIASQPVLNGHLEGVELCAQFQCGVAVFVGQFKGQVNDNRDKGGFLVFVNHQEPLPANKGETVSIISGEWSLRAGANLFQGDVLQGNIINNGNNTFTLTVRLQLAEGGSGEIIFTGILDHNDFPPTVEGDLAQPAAS